MKKSADGRDSFYRQLKLDKHTMKLVKCFRKVKHKLLNEK